MNGGAMMIDDYHGGAMMIDDYHGVIGKTGLYGASEEVKKCNVLCVGALPLQVGEGGEVSGNEFILGTHLPTPYLPTYLSMQHMHR